MNKFIDFLKDVVTIYNKANINPESIKLEGKYIRVKTDTLSINNQNNPVYREKDSQDIFYFKQQKGCRKLFSFSRIDKRKLNMGSEGLEENEALLDDTYLGVLYYSDNSIKGKGVGTDRDNGRDDFINIEYNENGEVQSFNRIYQESGRSGDKKNNDQFPLISYQKFIRVIE